VIFRVCTTSDSGSLVDRTGYDLSPLDVVLAVFSEVACLETCESKTARIPKKPNDSPRDLHFSLRVGPSARPPSCAVPEGTGA
jgi:hypothetical protein